VRKVRNASGKVACRSWRRQRASYLKVSTTATWTYGWDNLNRMVGVKQVTATGTQLSVSYSYDVLGNRVEDDTWKASTGTTLTVRHAYDGSNIWADVTTTNTLLARYVYGDGVDQVWARAVPAGLTNSGVAWYLTDREGSVRDIMDSSSVIQDHIDYDGYGNATHTTISVGDQFGYAGGLYSHDTKMEQFGARWYDPATGRWVSEDPSGFGGGDQNLYRYCGNGPTDAVDPTGLWYLYFTVNDKELLFDEWGRNHSSGNTKWEANWSAECNVSINKIRNDPGAFMPPGSVQARNETKPANPSEDAGAIEIRLYGVPAGARCEAEIEVDLDMKDGGGIGKATNKASFEIVDGTGTVIDKDHGDDKRKQVVKATCDIKPAPCPPGPSGLLATFTPKIIVKSRREGAYIKCELKVLSVRILPR
jgi:RHS repeat-associated protein